MTNVINPVVIFKPLLVMIIKMLLKEKYVETSLFGGPKITLLSYLVK